MTDPIPAVRIPPLVVTVSDTATINRRAVEILFAEGYFDRNCHKWLGFNSGEHYGVLSATGRVVFGPRTSQGVIDWIDAHGRPDAFNYSNASRYQLAKSGLYPRTKAGNTALARDVEAAARVGYAAAARVARCDEKTICADYRRHAAKTGSTAPTPPALAKRPPRLRS